MNIILLIFFVVCLIINVILAIFNNKYKVENLGSLQNIIDINYKNALKEYNNLSSIVSNFRSNDLQDKINNIKNQAENLNNIIGTNAQYKEIYENLDYLIIEVKNQLKQSNISSNLSNIQQRVKSSEPLLKELAKDFPSLDGQIKDMSSSLNNIVNSLGQISSTYEDVKSDVEKNHTTAQGIAIANEFVQQNYSTIENSIVNMTSTLLDIDNMATSAKQQIQNASTTYSPAYFVTGYDYHRPYTQGDNKVYQSSGFLLPFQCKNPNVTVNKRDGFTFERCIQTYSKGNYAIQMDSENPTRCNYVDINECENNTNESNIQLFPNVPNKNNYFIPYRLGQDATSTDPITLFADDSRVQRIHIRSLDLNSYYGSISYINYNTQGQPQNQILSTFMDPLNLTKNKAGGSRTYFDSTSRVFAESSGGTSVYSIAQIAQEKCGYSTSRTFKGKDISGKLGTAQAEHWDGEKETIVEYKYLSGNGELIGVISNWNKRKEYPIWYVATITNNYDNSQFYNDIFKGRPNGGIFDYETKNHQSPSGAVNSYKSYFVTFISARDDNSPHIPTIVPYDGGPSSSVDSGYRPNIGQVPFNLDWIWNFVTSNWNGGNWRFMQEIIDGNPGYTGTSCLSSIDCASNQCSGGKCICTSDTQCTGQRSGTRNDIQGNTCLSDNNCGN